MKQNIYHWLILTGVPFENSGGGQRAAQISKSLLKHGHKITYIYAIDYKEQGCRKENIINSNFKTFHISKFSIYEFFKSLNKNHKLIILIEVPHFNFLPILKILKKRSFKIIYEKIDPWDTELGKGWYYPHIEDEILKHANILTSTALDLQKDLEQRVSKKVYLIPNAYDKNLFNTDIEYKRPKDLPISPIIGYIGALWGSWFDMDLILLIAKKIPSSNIVLIGEYLGQFDNIRPSNVYFLGLKPQNQLPAYLSYFQVGIIPFKINNLTAGVNPLKVYEYLAMNLPVVSTNMPELKNIPNLLLADNYDDYINKINLVLNNKYKSKNINNWLNNQNWDARIGDLLKLVKSK
jgi:glycosyltransferase involved in cell wall biosynthesis